MKKRREYREIAPGFNLCFGRLEIHLKINLLNRSGVNARARRTNAENKKTDAVSINPLPSLKEKLNLSPIPVSHSKVFPTFSNF